MSFTNVLSAVIKILNGFSVPQQSPCGTAPNGETVMQKWTLQRMQEANGCVFGNLSRNPIQDTQQTLVTLENPAVMIPAGVYSLSLYNSPHAGHVVPLLNDVPGRTEIEMHCGNVPCDSKGCLLVGLSHDTTQLNDSRIAFDRLMSLLRFPVQITILDA